MLRSSKFSNSKDFESGEQFSYLPVKKRDFMNISTKGVNGKTVLKWRIETQNDYLQIHLFSKWLFYLKSEEMQKTE